MYKIKDILDLEHTIAKEYLESFEYPHEALSGIAELTVRLGNALDKDEYDEISPQVWVSKSAKVAPSAYIAPPCIIGPGTEVRHCAFIRGSVIVGESAVVGNSTELKNAIIFDSVEVPHFNYIGDSILGYKSHMGAGSITSNVKSDKKNIVIHTPEGDFETGLFKMGAILGDYAEVGCNSVLNPGTIVGRCSNVYPLSSVRGVVPSECIYKAKGDIVRKK